MKIKVQRKKNLLLFIVFLFLSACGGSVRTASNQVNNPILMENNSNAFVSPEPSPITKIPDLQAELFDEKNSSTNAPIGKFDFKNFTYPLPRGWQDSDSKEAELVNGKRPMQLSEEVEKIGLSYQTTKFFDATGDGQDDAAVILKIETGGSAIPQLVYIFEWKDEKPHLIWYFRTGDRSDGGLKNIYAENGEVVIELYGQDRYIVGELDTHRIPGDETQICCPAYWTKSFYKWNGRHFRLQGKRLTYSIADKDAPPIENMIEIIEKQNSGRK